MCNAFFVFQEAVYIGGAVVNLQQELPSSHSDVLIVLASLAFHVLGSTQLTSCI